MMWKLQALISHANHNQTEINGKWVPPRPILMDGLGGFRLRLKAAWAVLVGRADAFTWPEGQ